jgi:L-arabinose isomerase
MSLHDENRRILERAARKLIMKNTSALAMLGATVNGMMNGGSDKEMAASVFGFDAESREPLDELIFVSVLNGLDEKDIDVIFQRYAQRKGLKF